MRFLALVALIAALCAAHEIGVPLLSLGVRGALQTDLEQLEHCLQSGEFALWSNFPVRIDLSSPKLDAPMRAFAEHLEVENGGLYTTPTGMRGGESSSGMEVGMRHSF